MGVHGAGSMGDEVAAPCQGMVPGRERETNKQQRRPSQLELQGHLVKATNHRTMEVIKAMVTFQWSIPFLAMEGEVRCCGGTPSCSHCKTGE